MSSCCDATSRKTWGLGYIYPVLTLNSFHHQMETIIYHVHRRVFLGLCMHLCCTNVHRVCCLKVKEICTVKMRLINMQKVTQWAHYTIIKLHTETNHKGMWLKSMWGAGRVTATQTNRVHRPCAFTTDSFSLWAVPAQIRGLGCWMEKRGSSFFSSGCFHSLWMNVILGNAPHEQWRKPLNPAELLRESVFDKRLPQWVPLIKRVKAWSYPPALWSSWLLLVISGF